jgi:hypothetical protein
MRISTPSQIRKIKYFIFYTIAGGRAKWVFTRGALSLILISSAPFPEMRLRDFPAVNHA